MTTITIPPVPAPPGAEADIWEDDHSLPYRVVHGPSRGVPGRQDVIVGTTAIQFTNGEVDDGSAHETPAVYIEVPREAGLTSAQARELAAVIVECAAEIDGWCGR